MQVVAGYLKATHDNISSGEGGHGALWKTVIVRMERLSLLEFCGKLRFEILK